MEIMASKLRGKRKEGDQKRKNQKSNPKKKPKIFPKIFLIVQILNCLKTLSFSYLDKLMNFVKILGTVIPIWKEH